jgi:hypothetical protein
MRDAIKMYIQYQDVESFDTPRLLENLRFRYRVNPVIRRIKIPYTAVKRKARSIIVQSSPMSRKGSIKVKVRRWRM